MTAATTSGYRFLLSRSIASPEGLKRPACPILSFQDAHPCFGPPPLDLRRLPANFPWCSFFVLDKATIVAAA